MCVNYFLPRFFLDFQHTGHRYISACANVYACTMPYVGNRYNAAYANKLTLEHYFWSKVCVHVVYMYTCMYMHACWMHWKYIFLPLTHLVCSIHSETCTWTLFLKQSLCAHSIYVCICMRAECTERIFSSLSHTLYVAFIANGLGPSSETTSSCVRISCTQIKYCQNPILSIKRKCMYVYKMYVCMSSSETTSSCVRISCTQIKYCQNPILSVKKKIYVCT
jgi:hypothetical protein